MEKKWVYWLVVLVLVIPGCSRGQQSTKGTEQASQRSSAPDQVAEADKGIGNQQDLKKLVIAYPSAGSMTLMPIIAAEHQGYYKQEGFAIELIEMKPPIAITAAAAGEVDYITPLGSSVTASIKGIPIKTVMVVTAKPMHVLITKKEIASIDQLKGKVVAINAVGDITEGMLQIVLKKAGMQYDDVKVIPISGAPPKISALESNQIDAAVIEPPHNFRAMAMGYSQLMTFANTMPVGVGALATGQNKLAQNPSEVLKVVRATLRGTQRLKSNREEAAALVVEWSKYDRDTAIKAYDMAIADDVWPSNGQGTKTTLQTTFDFSKEQAKVDPAKEIPLDQAFDFDAVRQAVTELGIK